MPATRIKNPIMAFENLLLLALNNRAATEQQRVDMLVALLKNFGEGNLPCIPVPMSSVDLPETDATPLGRHKSLHEWKQSSVSLSLLTAIYYFIVDPYASITVRAFLKYTRDQLQHENVMEASQSRRSSDAKNLSQYMRTSAATYSLFRLYPTVGDVVTVGGPCLLVNGKPCAEPLVLGQQELEVCQSRIPSIDTSPTNRFAVIVIMEPKMSVTSTMRYAPQIEIEVLKRLKAQGHKISKVDVMMIATEGWCTRHFAVVASTIIAEVIRLWLGHVTIVHRTDNDVHQNSDWVETAGASLSQFIDDFLEPMTERWGIHKYRMLPDIQDTHVDQIITLAGGSRFPEVFAAQFAREMAKHSGALAASALVSQPNELPPS